MPVLSRVFWRIALPPAPSTRRIAAVLRPGRRHRIDGVRIVLTGASSGIGRAAALALAAEGAELVLVARSGADLERVRERIATAGGTATCLPCDLSDPAAVDLLAVRIRERWGEVDVLVNNAARSIRRPLTESFDRFHDFERVMAVNYFGAARLTMALLPGMIARGGGHVVNVGTWTVPVGSSPNFAAYHSSKTALTAFGRCVRAELARSGIGVTEVHYPLVHTAMSAPTAEFAALPGLTPERAADWIVAAVRTRPARLLPRYAAVLAVLGALAPRTVDAVLRHRN
ncbi:SDR family NAD(P)-dependent oxidoreductase [Nocardia takedensis]